MHRQGGRPLRGMSISAKNNDKRSMARHCQFSEAWRGAAYLKFALFRCLPKNRCFISFSDLVGITPNRTLNTPYSALLCQVWTQEGGFSVCNPPNYPVGIIQQTNPIIPTCKQSSQKTLIFEMPNIRHLAE